MTLKFDFEEIVHGGDRQTNFGTMLLKLIFKADMFNREKLRKGFPNAVYMVERYLAIGIVEDIEYD